MTEHIRVTALVKRLFYLRKQFAIIPSKNFQFALNFISNKLYRINCWVSYFLIRLSTMGSFCLVVYCSKRNVSFAWWEQHFNNIILAMRNFIFMKIILTFQSFNRREEKIKWRYIFPYLCDLYIEEIFFNNTDVWRFDLFIEEKKKYNDKYFFILLQFV